MANFILTISFEDDETRTTRKHYTVVAADFDAAVIAAGLYVIDLQELTEAKLTKYVVGQETAVAGTQTTGSNLDEGATFSARVVSSFKKPAIKVPAPFHSVRVGDGTIDMSDVKVSDWVAHFTAGTILGPGETIIETIPSGRLDK